MSKLKRILNTPIKSFYLNFALLIILIVLYINADIKYVPQFLSMKQSEQTLRSANIKESTPLPISEAPHTLYTLQKATHNTSKITPQECKLCGIDCTSVVDVEFYTITDNNRSKKLVSIPNYDTGSKSIDFSVFLIDLPKCLHVLNTSGTGLLDFISRTDSPYPDIAAHSSISADTAVYYFYSWNGKKYNKATEEVAAAMNKDAVQLIRYDELTKAIDILQIATQAEEENAEIMNNFGYAVYLLAKQEKPEINYKEARIWLEKSLKNDPDRWSAYLNLGDLFYDNNDIMYATKYYRKLLEIKPNYKFSKKIKDRINELIVKLSKPGDSITGPSTDFGMSTVTYTRLEDGRVERKEYFEGGQLYAVHHLKDGYADGEYIAYWSYRGGIRVKGQFSKGSRSGKFIYYDEKGKVVNEIIYDAKNASSKLEENYRDF